MTNSNYPPGVSPRDFDESPKRFKLVIEDPLARGYAEIDGMEFDTHATVTLVRHGERGPIEVTELETRSLYIIVHSTKGPVTLQLDTEHLSTLVKRDIERAIEARAKQLAEVSFDWEPLDECEGDL